MRDLYIHIGLHKTGSTYLQHSLLENRALLEAAGLGLAPWLHPIEGNHYPLLRALREAAWDPAAAAAIFDTIAETPGEALLITVEDLCWAMSRPAQAAVFHAAAARHFTPRAVIFLRRQDMLKESIFTQAVKTWYTGPIAAEAHYDYDHDGRLRALEGIFGRENVHVVLYRDGGPNDITGGLLDALGLDLDRSRLVAVPPQNVSMHRRMVRFMSELPKPPGASKDRTKMQFARRIAGIVQGAGAIADDGGRFLMSPRERHDLVARHLEGNRALVARHAIADPGGFLEAPDPDAPWAPPAPITGAERRAALAAVLRAGRTRRNPFAALAFATRAGAAFARMART
jgi:hypothetical protein